MIDLFTYILGKNSVPNLLDRAGRVLELENYNVLTYTNSFRFRYNYRRLDTCVTLNGFPERSMVESNGLGSTPFYSKKVKVQISYTDKRQYVFTLLVKIISIQPCKRV